MQGAEVVLARISATVAGAVAKSLLSSPSGAGLVRDPIRRTPWARGQAAAQTDRLADALARRLADAYPGLADNERLAAAEDVRTALAAVEPLDLNRVFAAGLDARRLREELPPPDAGLSERGRALYAELLLLCCEHAVEQLTAHPSFLARAAVEQTRHSRQLLEEGLPRPRPTSNGGDALAFEQRYADFVARTHGRLELFGLTLGQSAREWSLEAAYISLSVSAGRTRQGEFGLHGAGQTSVRVDQALSGADRLVLRGPAGSGKSTLVQWLALNAARRGFGADLSDWNRCVPFVLRLRAFTSVDALPSPDEFLRAAGVPLHGAAPTGWVESLLSDGRALVLVDGVDEVPLRLRRRTEIWLKSLITAYPHARYVVTTRPSAIPEDWLAPHGFIGHSLLPMERGDLRSFIGHWHEAARQECHDDRERALLDSCEAALRRAVTTRRDLGRLATNPLMCALLCALNRDRRMQLPRARKELYDAALDMLLVRRDTEREVSCVEGVDLTREEQTTLLRKLAYWLIRNGQVEADRAEAVEMVAWWLTAMPQVQGTAEQVFTHLLIRSGLLREPVPGAVEFVHRTFQDYLGAKAAVEERDFGALVKNAHDDTWDDVVQMAVGHARVEERARLLKKLLQRADRAPRLSHRLVLLATACLEHAPELDPGVRATVEERAKDLLPPRSQADAEELAKAGELALELLAGLPEPQELSEYEAAAVVRTAELVKGDAAFAVVARFREDTRDQVALHVSRAWGAFETEPYATEILAENPWNTAYLRVTTPEQLKALRHVPHARHVFVTGDHADLSPLHAVAHPKSLVIDENDTLTDLSLVTSFPGLTVLGLSWCPSLRDLTPLAGTALEHLTLTDVSVDVCLEPLRDISALVSLHLNHPVLVESVAELPVGEQLTCLSLARQTRHVGLDGLGRWPRLTQLTLTGQTQLSQLALMREEAERITCLALLDMAPLDLSLLTSLTHLRELLLVQCQPSGGLEPLRDLPDLANVRLTSLSGPLDLSALADRAGLTVTITDDMSVTGAELFPPERLVVRRDRI
ncbi:NACHT domain-containing protein [Streptomyces apocyni]|uniref:NACHT domain-containing protein n=1 Tax=Streptomyces apocyni TaxID=2654677 RepID=UPI0018CFF20D|nr:NACHT domain-containing protein [Streptomyces apocyni]